MSRNLLSDLPSAASREITTVIIDKPGIRIERIVTAGQASPPGFWYDQAFDEWVLLLAGAARLEIAGTGEVTLKPGDHRLIAAHCRHRVVWTTPDETTVWLAVHLQNKPAES